MTSPFTRSPTALATAEWVSGATITHGSSQRVRPRGHVIRLDVRITSTEQAASLLRGQLPTETFDTLGGALQDVLECRLDIHDSCTDLTLVLRHTQASADAMNRLANDPLVQVLETTIDFNYREQGTYSCKLRVTAEVLVESGDYLSTFTRPTAEFPKVTDDFLAAHKVTTNASIPAPDQLPKAREPETRFRQWSASLKGR